MARTNTYGGIGSAPAPEDPRKKNPSLVPAPTATAPKLAPAGDVRTGTKSAIPAPPPGAQQIRELMFDKAWRPFSVKTDPNVGAMKTRLAMLQKQAPGQMKLETVPGGGPQLETGPLKEFNTMRDRTAGRINSQFAADTQTAQDALQRRFAAMGGLNSGAALKQEQMLLDRSSAGKQNAMRDAMEGLDVAESQERQRRNEFQTQRYDALQEAAKGRNMSRDAANIDSAFKNKVFLAEHGSKVSELDLAFKEQAINKQTLEFNKLVAALEGGQVSKKHGLIGGLFGDDGVPFLKDVPVIGGLFE